LVADLNRRLIGWANYFYLGPVSQAYRAVEMHGCRRLRQWLCAKHQVSGHGTGQYPDVTRMKGWGWSVLRGGLPVFRGRNREPLSESRMR
jgi:hypothetical protein